MSDLHNFDTFKKGLTEYNVALSDLQRDQFTLFYDLLIEKNKVMNLTAITEWRDVVTKHFLDSLSLLLVVGKDELSGKRLLDLGTGAGFPGIPLSIMLPDLSIILIDSLQKRVAFLEEVIKALSLSNVKAIHGRAEDLARDPLLREQMDVVVSRAVAHLSILSEYCLPFVQVGGCFVAYKSASKDEELKESNRAVDLLGGEIFRSVDFQIPGTDLPRSLIVIHKKKASSSGYPRKAGIPKKKPL